ncbi:hypothetical protein [Bosea minatitlanensis]|uniref:Uncharacterized protein n=1 Tax=Bosea minatitlanensis TaxID=128782 RepID=A0ABW0EZR8_9HYPH|nr:hypothetical protein [Bosea minatitlanensis]MCT4492697.1 hypothetical protein [Bosea minatitlanensis]
MSNTIAVFQISTEEDLRFQLDFTGLDLAGRTLRVNVRERASNALKVSLVAPANLTLVGAGNLTAFYPKGSMNAWATGEYEADVVDETGGSFTRIMAVRFVYDEPGKLVYGVKGNQATVKWGGNQAVVTAIGGVGPPGPANVLTIGDVETLETGEPATAAITGTAPNQTLNLGLPKGNTGEKGWAPVFALAADGERFVFMLTDWVGGEGDPPPTTSGGDPLYIGAGGLTPVIGDAFDTRGGPGPQGDPGGKGWSPVFAIAVDGARRVLQVYDWVGGEGTKPATGGYVADDGLTPTIGDAADIRGPAGTATIVDGDKGDITTSDDGDTWTINAGAVDNAKLASMATARIKGRVTAGTGDPEDLTAAQVKTALAFTAAGDAMVTAATAAAQTALLSAFVGDSGSGGTKGLVPAPAAGDAAAGKFLAADGTYKTITLPAPSVIDRVVATNTTYSLFSSVIPLDDTIPQSNEGSQILAATITPKSATNKLRITAELPCASQTAVGAVCAAIFDGTANALKAVWRYGALNYGGVIVLTHEYVNGSVGPVTIAVRMGAGSSSNGVSINGTASGRLFGGTMSCRLEVEEIKA